jgi:Flp pilus assembly protein TadG
MTKMPMVRIGRLRIVGLDKLWLRKKSRQLVKHRNSFIADQRGAVALETLIVMFFLITSLLLPLADLGIAGFQFLFAWQALRNFGQ